MANAVSNASAGPESPAWTAAAITPNDGADIGNAPCRGLWVGVTGDVSVVMAGGGSVTFVGVQGLLPVRVDRVNATGTTATSIVALF